LSAAAQLYEKSHLTRRIALSCGIKIRIRESTYQIWSLYIHSLRRYERRYEMSKMGWFGGS